MLAIIVICTLLTPQAPDAKPPPNVLFLSVDDMNRDSVGVFGCELEGTTPHIDKLARQGMRFDHAHVNIAICQPTRAVWMTGRYPHNNGALGFGPINKNVSTLPEALHAAGFLTGILGKNRHVVPTRSASFDIRVDEGELQTGRSVKLYAEHTRSFLLRAKQAKKPFFLMVNTHDPHRPFAGSAQEKGRIKKVGRAAFPNASKPYSADQVPVPGFLPDLPPIRKEMAEYFTSVRRADQVIGAVLEELQASGLADNTIVIFLSDHGMPLPFAKTNCWRHSTITPLIIRWPGKIEADHLDTQHLVSGVDLAPTIFAATGVKPLPEMDGRSFLPLLRGKAANRAVENSGDTGFEPSNTVLTMINTIASKRSYAMRSLQDRRYGYIFNAWADGERKFRNESQAGRTFKAMKKAAATDEQIAARVRHFVYRCPDELYDYAEDPDARHNLVNDPKHAELLGQMRQLLLERMRETHDPLRAKFELFLER